MRDVKTNGRDVMIELLRKGIREPREPSLLHPQRLILALDVTGRNEHRLTDYIVSLYCYYVTGRIAPRCFHADRIFAVGLDDDAMRTARAESIADRWSVRWPAIRRNLGRVHNAVAEIGGKERRVFQIALANTIAQDRLRGRR